MWEKRCYSEGIPEEVEPRISQLNKAPSYKQICSIILKNDNNLKGLGYEPKKNKYYHDLKKIELKKRGVLIDNQLSLF
jgi:predicted phosphoadenosine phosphosulfate sulfurtransferase